MKVFLRLIKILVVVLVLLWIITLVIFTIFMNTDVIEESIKKTIHKHTGYVVTFNEKPSISLFPTLKVNLKNVSASSPNEQNSSLEIGEIDVYASALPLLSKTIKIESITIKNSSVSFTSNASILAKPKGTASIQKEDSSEDANKPSNKWQVDYFSTILDIQDLTINYLKNNNENYSVHIKSIATSGNLSSSNSFSVLGSAVLANNILNNIKIEGNVKLNNSKLLNLELEKVSLEYSKKNNPKNISLDFSAIASISLNNKRATIKPLKGFINKEPFNAVFVLSYDNSNLKGINNIGGDVYIKKLDTNYLKTVLNVAEAKKTNTIEPNPAPRESSQPKAKLGNNAIDLLKDSKIDLGVRVDSFIFKEFDLPVDVKFNMEKSRGEALVNSKAFGGDINSKIGLSVVNHDLHLAINLVADNIDMSLLGKKLNKKDISGKLSAKFTGNSRGIKGSEIEQNLAGNLYINAINLTLPLNKNIEKNLSKYLDISQILTINEATSIFSIKNNVATSQKIDIVSKLFKANGSGWLNFKLKQMDFNFDVLIDKNLPKISVSATGDVEKPKFKIEQKASLKNAINFLGEEVLKKKNNKKIVKDVKSILKKLK